MLKNIRDQLYQRWLLNYPKDQYLEAMMRLPLQMRDIHSMPFLAPHFVNSVLTEVSAQQHEIITTLDLRLQKIVERTVYQYIERKRNLDVNNAAVMIVDTRNMGIKALLGSANFFDQTISGQINGTEIKRSPGSSLKPFIYALAMEQGLIHPGTVLKDVPSRFGSYNPENFDNDFMGPIKARDALILSRNIPAIYLADQLKNPSLYTFLQQAGIRNLKSEEYYGLALVLGGAEVSMRELVGLYATLSNEGLWRPIKSTEYLKNEMSKRLLSPESSYLILDILERTSQEESDKAIWKTGTSSGYRDAWTMGIVGPYVIGVWIGNFNNQGNPVFIGKQMAAPLFFEIANAMNRQNGGMPIVHHYPERLNLIQQEICKSSGMLPTRYCKETEKVWFIPGKSPIQTDTIHREIAIDSQTGFRACQFDEHTRFEIYEFWSSDLLKNFKRAGIQRRIPPPYNASCIITGKAANGLSPQIISPQTHVNYVSRIQAENKTIIPLTAIVDADVSHLYWFINKTFLGKTTRDKSLLWYAKAGKFVIRVVDDYGRSDARDVIVNNEITK